MPPKKTDGSDSASVTTGLRENELRFIKAVFDNMTQKPDADWAQVAGDLGLKDAKCAKERFRQMSVRHGWRTGTQGTAMNSPSKGKKNDVTGPSGDGKVTKKPKARTTKKPVAKKEESEDDDIKDEDDDLKSEEMEDAYF
ncbi:uncharacterized protein Triagg1_6505 [Trichoderma aggressivum f. europaeum]|uniref:Myb-like domain-containing protein n=1 Tax=Trichoderma aggressivum f. europaeum TaxID=173218 RepID=A0AAE1IAN4_9HYPO|nr:hypothetical protein Triagg1_6505 [Trichoderma aggressivum f. europaeum]